MELNVIIKRGRLEKGLTQAKLADMLKVNKQTVYSWEKGQYVPDGKLLIQLGEMLDIVDDLFPSRKQNRYVTVDELNKLRYEMEEMKQSMSKQTIQGR